MNASSVLTLGIFLKGLSFYNFSIKFIKINLKNSDVINEFRNGCSSFFTQSLVLELKRVFNLIFL